MTSRQLHRAATGLFATTLLALAVGCASRPTAPEPTPGDVYVNPQFLTLGPIPSQSTFSSAPGNPGRELKRKGSVDGAVGGTVCLGRFRVEVPAGAFDGVGDITIVVPDSLELRCDLQITPGRLNAFRVPVLLHVDCSGASNLADPAKLAIVRFEPSHDWWREVAGDAANAATIEVLAPLEHFSDYGVVAGKAGW